MYTASVRALRAVPYSMPITGHDANKPPPPPSAAAASATGRPLYLHTAALSRTAVADANIFKYKAQ